MPKVAVICDDAEGSTPLADGVVDGLRSTRFMEADRFVCRGDGGAPGGGVRVLDRPDTLRGYDGVVMVHEGSGALAPALLSLLDALDALAPARAFQNTVFGVAGGEDTPLQSRVHRLGGIIVSAPRTLDDPESAPSALGARVAKVVGWIRHALSHEHHH